MTENVNYEDNLFFISQTIDLLRKGALLNLDRELFYQKIMETLFSTDASLQSIYKNLTENSYLINRNLYLHSVMKKKRKFTEILTAYLEGDPGKWLIEEEHRSRLQRIREIHTSDIQDIRSTLSLTADKEEDREVISRDEMNFLMAPGLLEEDE